MATQLDQKPDQLKKPYSEGAGGDATIESKTGSMYQPDKPSRLQTVKSIFQGRRGLLIGGGGGLLITMAFAVISFIAPLNQLLHIKETFANFFDSPHERAVSRRLGPHYRTIFDPENGDFDGYKRKGGLRALIGNVNRDRLVTDMRSRGFEFEFNQENGRLVAIDTPNGRFGGSEGFNKLSDARSATRQALREIYPERGVIWRTRKAGQLFTRLGIRRTFFENKRFSTRERFNEWFRNKVYGEELSADADGVRRGEGVEEDERAANSDFEEATEDFNNDAQEQRQTLLSDGSKGFKDINNDRLTRTAFLEASQRLAQNTAARGIAGFFGSGLAVALDGACEIKYSAAIIEEGSKTLRAEQLATYAGPIMVAADQLKTSENVDIETFDYTNELFTPSTQDEEGYSNAAAWAYVNGDSNITSIEQEHADNYGIGNKGTNMIESFNEFVNVPIVDVGCGVFTNLGFQIGAGVISAVVSIGTVGTFEAFDTGVAIAAGVAEGIFLGIVRPIIVDMIAGTIVDGFESPEEAITAAAAGYSVLANTNALISGANELNPQEVADIRQKTKDYNTWEVNQKGFVYKWLSPENHNSLVSRMAYGAPQSWSDLKTKTTNYLATINPLNTAKKISWYKKVDNSINGSIAYADEGGQAIDIFGVPQYGWTDEQIDKYDILENADWVEARMDEYEDYIDECVNPLSANLYRITEEQGNCNSDEYERFRIYHFDTILLEDMKEFTEGLD